MIQNYFKIAWRNLLKNKLFSLINILGLGLAIPFALLALIQVQSAFETDNFHPFADRTYRIVTDVTQEGGSKIKYASSPQDVSKRLAAQYPFVESSTTVIRQFGWVLNKDLKSIDVNTIYVEPAFFNIFGFSLVKGSIPSAPNTLAITEEKAKVFFGDEDPLGKSLTHPDFGTFLITGVIKNYKRNTHLRSDIMVSMETYKKFQKENSLLNGYSYILLRNVSDRSKLNHALTAIASCYNKESAAQNVKERLEFRLQAIDRLAPDFQGLRDNPYIDSWNDLAVNFAFALALLMLAAFNYINLTLAKSISRSKEVGIRKVSGALRYQLIVQFICEAVLISLLSLVLGYIVLKFIEHFTYVSWFSWQVDNQWVLWITFVLFSILSGVLAGIIPARILSGFQPVKVLKGTVTPSSFGKIGLRNILVITQFVVTACFIFVLAALYSQLKYMAKDNINFNRQNIYNIAIKENPGPLKHDLLLNKNIERIGMTSLSFGGAGANASVKKLQRENNAEASYYAVDVDFVNNMQIKIISGKNIPASTSNSPSPFVLVNERLLSALNLGSPGDAPGKKILMNDSTEVIIAGVTENFCYGNYQFMAKPLVMQYDPSQFKVMVVKTRQPANETSFYNELLPLWKQHFPHEEFFLSDFSKTLYESYFPTSDIRFMMLFCIILVVIAVMGLLGIVTYDAEKRIKEIGIRKVMGASVPAIVQHLAKSFLKLMVIAAVISFPLGYAGSKYFTKLFAYNQGVNLLLMTGLFAIIFLLALITIIYNSVKAASVNPIKSLRTE